MRGRVFAAIRRWLSVSRMRGDKQQADSRPDQIPYLSHHRKRHTRHRLHGDYRSESAGQRLVDADPERHELEGDGHHAIQRFKDDRLRERRAAIAE